MEGNDNVTMSCLYCETAIKITPWTRFGSMMYRGTCQKESCKRHMHQYMCRWCIDYLKGNPPLGRIGGGRPSGVFRNVKGARQHFKNSTHVQAGKSQQSPDIIVDQATLPMDLDENEFTNTNDGDNLHETAPIRTIDFVNNCGFSIKFQITCFL